MPDALRRAVRTFAQAVVGVLMLETVSLATNPNLLLDVSWLQRVGLACLAAGCVALVTWLHNWLEDSPSVALPSLLKARASGGVNPATTDPK